MRYLPQILCVLGILALLFSYWGINTAAGRRQFDEMAGMIPFGVGILGAVLLLAGLIWLVVRWRS